MRVDPVPNTGTNTLRRMSGKIDFRLLSGVETSPKRRKRGKDVGASPGGGGARRKPTLIRNLGGVGAEKGVSVCIQFLFKFII